MKKVILIFMLLLSIPIMAISTYALDFSGSVEGDYVLNPKSPNLVGTTTYNVRIKIDEVTLSSDMTTWYNAIDSVYALPHVYYFDESITLLNDDVIMDEDIAIMHVDYDLAGASSSTIYFYDESEVLLYSIDMHLLTNTLSLETTVINEFVFNPSYDYTIIDDFSHTLQNWDFTSGLSFWNDYSDDPNTWEVIDGGALDGFLNVTTIDSNSMLTNYASLIQDNDYYIRYDMFYESGTGFIAGFDNNIYFDGLGYYETIDTAFETHFSLVALDDTTSYYINEIVVLDLTTTFGATYPNIATISHLVDVWLGVESVSLVNWLDYDDTLLKSEYVLYGNDGIPPSEPSRVGYTFNGWDTTYTNILISKDITATYTITEYTISFETNGGNLIADLTLNYGDSIVKPSDPTRAGYIFVGWYRNENLTTSINFNTYTVNADITLYAKWITSIDDGINEFLEDAGFSTSFYKTLLSVAIIVFIVIIMGFFKVHKLILLIVSVSLLLLAIALGFIPTWITILIVIIVFGLFYLSLKGGSSSE